MASHSSFSLLPLVWSPTRRSWPARLAFLGVGGAAAGLVVAALAFDLQEMGYLGVFVASFTSSASMFVPLPGLAVLVAASLVLHPWAVGLLAAIGGALGEMTGYAVGCSSHRILARRGVPGWVERAARSHMALTILAVSVIPNPFVDFVGLAAGRLCYPVKTFLTYTIIGKTVRGVVLAYGFAWGLPGTGGWLS